MYELWLMLNIVYELARPLWPLWLALAVLWAALLAWAAARADADWRRGLRVAIVAALVALPLAFVAVPTATRSSLGELRYWVDWLSLAGIAAAVAVAVAAFAWPLAARVLHRGAH
jgi:ABC-type glycerol-3-phosphate transport system permease component